jgi:hypothetical protein
VSTATDAKSDVPNTLLEFVDPHATVTTYRVCLWAAPGQGKSVAAASAPDPILVLNADRPTAYMFARKHHAGRDIREVRYVDADTLEAVYRYLASDDGKDVRTLVIDPISHVYDQLVDSAPLQTIKGRTGPNYQAVNKKLLGFIQALRTFDVNVVLVAHEKLGDGDDGGGKLYPALGGPSLINKLLAEMDIVAHIERHVRTREEEDEVEELWVGQIQPRDNLVCKDSTGGLGDRRIADLSRWFEVASEALAPDLSDVPFVGDPAEPTREEIAEALPIDGEQAA